jgi:Glycosyl transferases group 1
VTTLADRRGICVLGRTDFHFGMGTLTYAACELLSRYFRVGLLPTRDAPRSSPADGSAEGYVTLPSGRDVPLVTSAAGFAASLYVDVVWNGVQDQRHELLPDSGIRVAQIAYDSDELPPEWVDLLNGKFDVALFTSGHLEEVAQRSGVTITTGTLPIALDLEGLLGRRYRPPLPRRLRFGSLSAFHDRKGLDVLIDAFLQLYQDRPDVELVLHSNLAIGDPFERISQLSELAGATNVRISHGLLSSAQKNALLESFDIYVNCSRGEGYSVGPREALALGKPIVVTQLAAHADFDGVPGVFHFAPVGRMPARYPEIDNRVFGAQLYFDVPAIAAGLAAAADFVRSSACVESAPVRRRLAARFAFTALAPEYRSLFDPDSIAVRPLPAKRAPSLRIDASVSAITRRAAGRHGTRLRRDAAKVVVPVHDGGFFSIFNRFISHLVWGLREDRVSLVVPDWNVIRLLPPGGGDRLTSYCYSRPEDGNLWLKLFEPLYDLTPEEMNDPGFMSEGAGPATPEFNEVREPLLTYVHAYDLYRAAWFPRFRNQYGRVTREYVRPRPELAAELKDTLAAQADGRFMISAHVKHPSHGLEQPGQRIAGGDRYVAAVRALLVERGIREASDDWTLFVATDQDRVVARFADEFGPHVFCFKDVSRIEPEVDASFDALSPTEQLRIGHQLQHLKASHSRHWSWRLAWEVWRDAEVMAASDVLLHAVSNVATAASYLGPRIRMIYIEP